MKEKDTSPIKLVEETEQGKIVLGDYRAFGFSTTLGELGTQASGDTLQVKLKHPIVRTDDILTR